jgi:hypothetical protein
MKISFFEEFPTKRNMEELALVSWPTTVFVAATGLDKFKSMQKKYTKRNVELAYWPILKKEEGYWMSPFSSPRALKRIMRELKGQKIKVLWDAELPWRHTWLFLKHTPYFFSNKRRIKKFLKQSTNDIYCTHTFTGRPFFKFLGVWFDKNVTSVPMCYASFLPGARLGLKNTQATTVGIGLIAKGVGPTDSVYSPKELDADLQLCKKKNIKEVIIFRLGGLNKNYLKTIKKYV